MHQTNVPEVCLDYPAVCRKALGTLRRRAVTEYIEAEELLSIGALALVEAAPKDEALAVVIARRAMIDAVRRNERRERGRVWPSNEESEGDEDSDAMDTLLSSGGHGLRPENTHPELWEALRALPAKQYRAVSLFFWGMKSSADIAEEMGVGVRAVERLISRAVENLGKIVNPDVRFFSPRAITNMRGDGTQRTVPSGRKDAA